jgi:hypothetical protein
VKKYADVEFNLRTVEKRPKVIKEKGGDDCQ